MTSLSQTQHPAPNTRQKMSARGRVKMLSQTAKTKTSPSNGFFEHVRGAIAACRTSTGAPSLTLSSPMSTGRVHCVARHDSPPRDLGVCPARFSPRNTNPVPSPGNLLQQRASKENRNHVGHSLTASCIMIPCSRTAKGRIRRSRRA